MRYLRWPLVTDACDSCCRLSFVCSCAISHMAGWPWRGPKTTEQVLVTLEVHHGCVTFLSLGLQYSVQKLANGSSPTIMIKQTKSGGIWKQAAPWDRRNNQYTVRSSKGGLMLPQSGPQSVRSWQWWQRECGPHVPSCPAVWFIAQVEIFETGASPFCARSWAQCEAAEFCLKLLFLPNNIAGQLCLFTSFAWLCIVCLEVSAWQLPMAHVLQTQYIQTGPCWNFSLSPLWLWLLLFLKVHSRDVTWKAQTRICRLVSCGTAATG